MKNWLVKLSPEAPMVANNLDLAPWHLSEEFDPSPKASPFISFLVPLIQQRVCENICLHLFIAFYLTHLSSKQLISFDCEKPNYALQIVFWIPYVCEGVL